MNSDTKLSAKAFKIMMNNAPRILVAISTPCGSGQESVSSYERMSG